MFFIESCYRFQKSAQFMRHAKRRRMNIDDFNKACKHSDIQVKININILNVS